MLAHYAVLKVNKEFDFKVLPTFTEPAWSSDLLESPWHFHKECSETWSCS